MKIICCGNQKGGCGKTTTTLNICYTLAHSYNRRVLLVDMDSQGSSSLNLGIDVASEDVHTIDDILEPYVKRETRSIQWEALKHCIYTPTFQEPVRDPNSPMKWITVDKPFGFDVIPASLHLSVVEMMMGLVSGALKKGINQYYLRDILNVIEEHMDYDYVVIDTPPSLGALSINAMAAAKDGIIIVSNLDVMSLRGISSFIDSAETIQQYNEGHRGILGILLALYSERRTVDRTLDSWVKEFLPIPTFDTRIPETADVKKANSAMLLVSQINKKSQTAYEKLCAEIIYALDNPTEPIGSLRKTMMETENAEA